MWCGGNGLRVNLHIYSVLAPSSEQDGVEQWEGAEQEAAGKGRAAQADQRLQQALVVPREAAESGGPGEGALLRPSLTSFIAWTRSTRPKD